jgi:hypothetical protein
VSSLHEPQLRTRSERARLAAAIVLLGASLTACYDSRRIIFRDASEFADAGGASGASPAPQPPAAAAAPAAALPGDQRAAAPGSLEATALGADPSPLDAGVAPGAVDAAAPDAAP